MDQIVPHFYTKERWSNTGPNHEPVCKIVKIPRKLGIQYEMYRLLGSDPNQYMLINDGNYNRLRVRKILTYIDKDGNMREKVEDNYPLDPEKYSDSNYDFRPWS